MNDLKTAPLDNSEYPIYFKCTDKLLAFTAKDKMYKIEAVGSNHNPGVTIDHYTTRNMVLKHWPFRALEKKVSQSEFKMLMQKLFNAYVNKITS